MDTKELLTRIGVFLFSFASVLVLFSGILFLVKKIIAGHSETKEIEN